MNLVFYQCDICGKILTILSDSGVPTYCCGQPMRELVPNRTDASGEKHVPVWCASGDAVTVRIGSTPHPMTEDHYITWIGLHTDRGFSFAELRPGDKPEARFCLQPGEQVLAAYAFCNRHGLWCSEKEVC